MKKFALLSLCLICGLFLAGCGGNDMMDDIGSGMESAKNLAESTVDKAADGAMELVASITGDQAKRVALEHAGLTEDQVTELDVDLDRDGMTLIFEVDFKSGDIEYDYDVNAVTGRIITADKDKN